MKLTNMKAFSNRIRNNPVDPAWLRGYSAGFEDAMEISNANHGTRTGPTTETARGGHNGADPTDSTDPTRPTGNGTVPESEDTPDP